VRRCAAFALIRLRDRRGLALFLDALSGEVSEIDGFMHYFAQLSREERMDLVRHAVISRATSSEALAHLEHALEQRTFDFHEELDYFHVLRDAVLR
jgi:hypothetical protein